jgi:hypothetical protein
MASRTPFRPGVHWIEIGLGLAAGALVLAALAPYPADAGLFGKKTPPVDFSAVRAMLPSELSLVADDLVAAVRSTRTIVSGSPTRRARPSSRRSRRLPTARSSRSRTAMRRSTKAGARAASAIR